MACNDIGMQLIKFEHE